MPNRSRKGEGEIMRRFHALLFAVLILQTAVAGAQIVLQPKWIGTVEFSTAQGIFNIDLSNVMVGCSSQTETALRSWPLLQAGWNIHYFQGVLEFDLAGAGLPTAAMTPGNFSARLDGLTMHGTVQSLALGISLFDLQDDSEDGQVSPLDCNHTRGPALGHTLYDPEQSNHDFTHIDVTEAIRRDLFGDGKGDTSSGFLLRASDCSNARLLLNSFQTTLVIRPRAPDAGPDAGGATDAGTDGGTDGGGSSVDSGTGPDRDAATEEVSPGGCGCTAVGAPRRDFLDLAIRALGR